MMRTQILAIFFFFCINTEVLFAQHNISQLDSLLAVSQNLASIGQLKQAKDRTLGLLATFNDSLSRAKIYSSVGDLCMSNFMSCLTWNGAEKSFIYLFAYDMYERAGNKSGMEQAKKHFHSLHDSFVCAPLPTSGSRVRIGCWIQDTTIFRWKEEMK